MIFTVYSQNPLPAVLVCYLAGRMLAGEADSGVRVERITGMLDLFPPD